jgi:hypothetical protein
MYITYLADPDRVGCVHHFLVVCASCVSAADLPGREHLQKPCVLDDLKGCEGKKETENKTEN